MNLLISFGTYFKLLFLVLGKVFNGKHAGFSSALNLPNQKNNKKENKKENTCRRGTKLLQRD